MNKKSLEKMGLTPTMINGQEMYRGRDVCDFLEYSARTSASKIVERFTDPADRLKVTKAQLPGVNLAWKGEWYVNLDGLNCIMIGDKPPAKEN